MPEGVIVGGWPSVIAAYSITAIVLGLYVWSLVHRGRRHGRPAGRALPRGPGGNAPRSGAPAASGAEGYLKRPTSVSAGKNAAGDAHDH